MKTATVKRRRDGETKDVRIDEVPPQPAAKKPRRRKMRSPEQRRDGAFRGGRWLLPRAKMLRKKWTPGELAVAHALDALEYEYLREAPVGPYIYDFCVYSRPTSVGRQPVWVLIETDGSSHNTQEAKIRDAKKTTYATENGFLFWRLDESTLGRLEDCGTIDFCDVMTWLKDRIQETWPSGRMSGPALRIVS